MIWPKLNGGPCVVAIAYILQKTPYVFPIIGGRKVEHLHSNIEALSIALTPKHIAYLESIIPFDIGFPFKYFVSCPLTRCSVPLLTLAIFRAMVPTITHFSRLPGISRCGPRLRPFAPPQMTIELRSRCVP